MNAVGQKFQFVKVIICHDKTKTIKNDRRKTTVLKDNDIVTVKYKKIIAKQK
jgi:hypothetical protein